MVVYQIDIYQVCIVHKINYGKKVNFFECHNSMSCLDEGKEGSGSMHQVFRQVTSFFNNVFLIRQGKQETPVEL